MTANRTALVAEASDSIRAMQAEVLKSLGFFVIEAQDGYQVLERLRKVRPALVVLDLALQGLDGTEVLHFLRRNEDWSAIPVVVCSAMTDHYTRQLVTRAGGTAFLEKPFAPESLQQVVGRLFEAKEAETAVGENAAPEIPEEPDGAHALLVSDRRPTREGLQQMLEEEGYAISSAAGVDEALLMISEAGAPDLVVVDWRTDPRAALRLVSILRRCRFGRQPRVLMICEPLDIRAMAAGAHAGVDHSLGEPVTRKALVDRLKRLGLR